jgi:GrpB-like predicted nucleotidyltransferase (UPF0157 family)
MIEVVPFDAQWPLRFEELRHRLADALEGVPIISIEHVGSTAVMGLAAKPTIDIDVVVAEQDVEAASRCLAHVGYHPRGDLGVPGRYAFRVPKGWFPTNTYVVVAGCLALRNHLAIRDALRSDPALREEYGALKLRLAASAPDIERYVEGKTTFLLRILALSGIGPQDLAEIEKINRA